MRGRQQQQQQQQQKQQQQQQHRIRSASMTHSLAFVHSAPFRFVSIDCVHFPLPQRAAPFLFFLSIFHRVEIWH